MAKQKSRRRRKRRQEVSPEVLRRRGAQAFQRGDYDLAIAAWRRVGRAHRDPELKAAFAEAHFRRGLEGQLHNLQQAVDLVKDEPRYLYHLALAHHRAGQLDEAESLYRRLLDQFPPDADIFSRAVYAWGLLLLETGRRASRDPLWGRLPEGSEACRRLIWAERLMFTESAPSGPAPDSLWATLAGRKDAARVDPGDLAGTAAAVAHHRQGAHAWEQGEVERAFEHWKKARESGLDFAALRDSLFAAARTLATERLKAGDVEGALEAATVGLAIDPGDNGLQTIAGQIHFRRGHAAALAGRWSEAHEHWHAVLDVGAKRSRRLVINLALVEEQRENWYEAAELWREAVRRRPRRDDHPDALDDTQVARLWHHVARCYERSGLISEAVKTFRNALKWAPDDVELRTAYVDLLLDDGRLTAADNQLDLLIEAHPNDVELLDRRAQIYTGRGHSHAAINILKRILDLQPDHLGARRQIARHYERMGDGFYQWGWPQEAMNSYQQGLEYAPDDGILLASMGLCQLDIGEEAQARQSFERALAAEPANAGVYVLIIQTWLANDDLTAADAILQRARENIDLSPFFFLELADFCHHEYLEERTRYYLTEARELAAENVTFLLMVADRAGHIGEYALAQEIVEQVLRIDAQHPIAHLIRGLALVSQGDLKGARRSWNRAEKIARRTDNPEVLRAVEELRFLYDPDRGPSLGLLRQMLGGDMFDDDALFDDEDSFSNDDQ